jgi:hypothetical protein
MVVLVLLVEDVLLEDDDANAAAINGDDENTAMAMPKINIIVVAPCQQDIYHKRRI